VKKTRKLTTMAMLFALAIVLSVVESMILPALALPPGVKLGLSNTVVMYCMTYLGRSSAFELALLKGVFALITRGPTAGLLSTLGGLFSVTTMVILKLIFKDKINYYTLSVFGALFHNLGQLVGTSFIFTSFYVMYYFPVLMISAVGMGLGTGVVLKMTIPALEKIR
jgi:heptaprenyl diphosphate synthase